MAVLASHGLNYLTQNGSTGLSWAVYESSIYIASRRRQTVRENSVAWRSELGWSCSEWYRGGLLSSKIPQLGQKSATKLSFLMFFKCSPSDVFLFAGLVGFAILGRNGKHGIFFPSAL